MRFWVAHLPPITTHTIVLEMVMCAKAVARSGRMTRWFGLLALRAGDTGDV